MRNAIERSKKYVLICVLLCGTVFLASAQTSRIDDLLSQLKASDPDTVQIKVLRKLSAAYTAVDPVKKFLYAQQYLHLSKKNNIDSSVANAYIDIGISYGIRSNIDSALHFFNLALDRSKAADYNSGIARSLGNIGFALDRSDRKKDAVKYYEESLKIYKKLNNRRAINQNITNIGSLYFDLKEYKTAEVYFKQVYESAKENPSDEMSLASALFSMGNVNRKLGRQAEALDFFQKSLALREKIGDLNGIALSNWGIGLSLNNKKEYRKALEHLQVALNNNRTTKNNYQEAAVLVTMADSYLHLDSLPQAEEYAKLALQAAKASGSKSMLADALKKITEVTTAQKKFADALKFQSDLISVNDSLDRSKTTKEIILNDLHRINDDNNNLTKDNKKIAAKITDYTITIAAITALLIVLVILLVLYYKRNAEKKAANELLLTQAKEIAEVNEELSALNEELKTQMEIVFAQNLELEKLNQVKNKFFSIVSHDLRGPINNLRMLFEMYRQGNLNAEELTALFSKLEDTTYNTAAFLDNLLEWSKSQLDGMVVNPIAVNLQDVITHNVTLLDSQIKLKSIDVLNNVAEDITVRADLNMVHVVIRNLFSNAVKFCKAGDSITFDARQERENIVCTIKDTGAGMTEVDKENLFNLTHKPNLGTSGEKGYHIGLILCRDMIAQNNGDLKVESGLGVGTTFYITLPCHKN